MANQDIQFSCELCQKKFSPTFWQIKKKYQKHYCCAKCRGLGRVGFKSESDRFWSKVDIRSKDECWEWKASRQVAGYGQFMVSELKRAVPASRMAWELTFDKIPDGLFALHKCDNPPCCNPNHIFLGTSADNTRDMWNKSRFPDIRHKEYCKNGHEMTTETYRIEMNKTSRLGSRRCIICKREYDKKYKAIYRL